MVEFSQGRDLDEEGQGGGHQGGLGGVGRDWARLGTHVFKISVIILCFVFARGIYYRLSILPLLYRICIKNNLTPPSYNSTHPHHAQKREWS